MKIKKHTLIYIAVFIPTCLLLNAMDRMWPNMKALNFSACLFLMFFIYLYFTIKTEIITIKKTQTIQSKHGPKKQICTTDGRCFDLWTGFKPSLYWIQNAVGQLPRITDTEFKKIKPGQKYKIQTFPLIGNQNFIWSLERVHTKHKSTRKAK